MLRLFKQKKEVDLAIIISQPHQPILGLESYANRYLLPFSPRFRIIDFALASLASINIKKIVVLTTKNKENISNYLINTWPKQNFSVFDQIDLENEFYNFFLDYTSQNPVDLIAVIRGDLPIWFDMNILKNRLQKEKIAALTYKSASETIIPAITVEKQLFSQKIISYLIRNQLSLSLSDLAKNLKASPVALQGFIQPIESFRKYLDFHLDLLDNYLMLDHFNSIIPICPNSPNAGIGLIAKEGHIINSIIGENTEVKGKVENSVIFPEVKIEQGCVIKDSVILPGNFIGKNTKITKTFIQESLYENLIPNIGANSIIGSETSICSNKDFPEALNFGYTLIGENSEIPSYSRIGGNAYIHPNFNPPHKKKALLLKDGESLLSH